ncbi:hypothetical protein BC936DRAFT_140929 [Jimgerdemannia flammicorona]|uniref:RGS domain-containing protein n=2 Tax=Jimgerdemannia flammicorona TaxID=994334 RepID=A0A433DGG9_9FUNG|nr:hypothetical protein BC936DRAFT_140929 [Jimgerdemannia flammicorona]
MESNATLTASSLRLHISETTTGTVVFAIWVSYGVFIFGTTILFAFHGRKNRLLAQRSWLLTVFGGFFNGVAGVLLMLPLVYYEDRDNTFPCFIPFLGAYFGIIPWILTFVGRAMRLIVTWRLNQLKMKTEPDTEERAERWTFWHLIKPRRQASIDGRIIVVMTLLLMFFWIPAITILLAERSNGMSAPSNSTLVLSATIQCSHLGAPEYYLFDGGMIIYLFVFCPFALLYLRKIQDAYGIMKDIMWTVLTCPLGFIMYILWITLLAQPAVQAIFWPILACFATHLSSVVIPLLLYYRQTLQPADHDTRDFPLVLTNPMLFALLCAHSIKDFTAENTRFIEEYQTLKLMCIESYRGQPNHNEISPPPRLISSRLPEKSDPSAIPSENSRLTTITPPTIYNITSPLVNIALSIPNLQPDEMVVPDQLKSTFLNFYTTFIRAQSVLEVNLEWQTRERIRQQIDSGVYTLDIFDEAKEHVLDLLFTNTLPHFLTIYKDQIAVVKRERTQGMFDDRLAIPMVPLYL